MFQSHKTLDKINFKTTSITSLLKFINNDIKKYNLNNANLLSDVKFYRYMNSIFQQYNIRFIYNMGNGFWQLKNKNSAIQRISDGTILQFNGFEVKALCVPPKVQTLESSMKNLEISPEVYEMQDGTVIYLAYNNGNWHINTRGGMLMNDLSFKNRKWQDVLNECFDDQKVDINLLDTKKSYGLILSHPDWHPCATIKNVWFSFEFDPVGYKYEYKNFPTGCGQQPLVTGKFGIIYRRNDDYYVVESQYYKTCKFLYYDSKLFEEANYYDIPYIEYIKTINLTDPVRYALYKSFTSGIPAKEEAEITQITQNLSNEVQSDKKIMKYFASQLPEGQKTLSFVAGFIGQHKYARTWAEHFKFILPLSELVKEEQQIINSLDSLEILEKK